MGIFRYLVDKRYSRLLLSSLGDLTRCLCSTRITLDGLLDWRTTPLLNPTLPRTYVIGLLFNFFRKGEDGSVDNSFYDWHYLGEYLQTPIMSVSIHSRTIDITIPQSTFSTHERGRTSDT